MDNIIIFNGKIKFYFGWTNKKTILCIIIYNGANSKVFKLEIINQNVLKKHVIMVEFIIFFGIIKFNL